MSRFGNNSLSSIEDKVKESEPKNTQNSKQYIWRQFMSFADERKYILNKHTSIPELANILKDWAFNMRRQNGQEYKEFTIKTIWNVTAKQLMEMYYKEFNIIFNPFTDIEFKTARDAKSAKRKQLQQIPEKRKESATFLKYEEFKKMVDTCNENDPDGLQKKIFFVFSFELAWRGGEGVKCLVRYFKEELDNEGGPTGRIQYNPVFSKTTQGGDKPCASSKWLIKNYTNPDICPVRLYRKFMEKRQGIKSDRFFLTVNPFWKGGRWYKDIPAGRNLVATWTSNQAKKSGLSTENKKITNHSLRATAVSKLSKEGIKEQELIKITGHSSTKSLTPYLQMDEGHHAGIIDKMRTTNLPALKSSASIPSPVQTSQAMTDQKTNTYYNCVFNSCNL